MRQLEKNLLLKQIAALSALERGKRSPPSSGRQQPLPSWQPGRNPTRPVPAEELPARQDALAGDAQYRQLPAAQETPADRGMN